MSSDNKRMCEWNRKKLKKELSDFTDAVEDPRYVCEKCIRVAHRKKHLCTPVALEKKK